MCRVALMERMNARQSLAFLRLWLPQFGFVLQVLCVRELYITAMAAIAHISTDVATLVLNCLIW